MPTTFNPGTFDPQRNVLPTASYAKQSDHATDLVVGISGKEQATLHGGADVTKLAKKLYGKQLTDVLLAQGATTKTGAISALVLPDVRVIAVGLGDDEPSAESLRIAAGSAARWIGANAGETERTVAFDLPATSPATIQAIAEGALLATDSFAKLGDFESKLVIKAIQIVGTERDGAKAVADAAVIAGAVTVARDWANLPPNLMAPADVCDQASGWFRGTKTSIEILDEKALAAAGYGGILAVGGGSVRPPRLLRVEYAPRGAEKLLVLVGKGITFDSGGYNIKPGASMVNMKNDMSGAADVLAAIHAIQELGLKIRVVAYAALAESLISGAAYRPSDVMTMYSGTTVENRNSDCEGRIVLADALARGCEDSPDLIVDIATLTGACMVALGKQTTGLFTNSNDATVLVEDAAEAAGEAVWEMPITDEVRGQLDSNVADLKSAGERFGGASFAAGFLERFISEGTLWAHLDVAGPAWNSGAAHDYVCTEGTGAGVRTLVALAQSMAS